MSKRYLDYQGDQTVDLYIGSDSVKRRQQAFARTRDAYHKNPFKLRLHRISRMEVNLPLGGRSGLEISYFGALLESKFDNYHNYLMPASTIIGWGRD